MPTLVTHVKSNIGNGLLSWFLENECDYFNDSLSLLLLKGAKIPLQVANVTDDALAKKAETFLKGYDAAYAVFDNDLNLPDAEKTEESKKARKLGRFLASMVDDYEDDHEKIFD